MKESLGLNQEKRIFNQIYNGASSYDFTPPLIGLKLDGRPDFYLNLIIGLAIKYFTKEKIEGLFALWQNHKNSDSYDLYAIYLLEDFCYKKELDQRPELLNLRKSYASSFLADKYDLKRKNLALRENLYYCLEMKKCSDILSTSYKLSKNETNLYENFKLPSDTNKDNLEVRILNLFEKFLSYKENARKACSFSLNFSFFDLRGTYQLERSNRADIFSNKDNRGINPLGAFIARRKTAKRAMIVSSFGKPLFSYEKEDFINKLCAVDKHKKSKVYFSSGLGLNLSDKINSLNAKALDANLSFFKKNEHFYQRIIKNLSKNIKLSLKSFDEASFELRKEGNLLGSLAWKSKIPNYQKIFSQKSYDIVADFKVDILLDGSASLLYKQEIVASEAYILSKALEANKISHRIMTYSSLGDYTVITFLKDFGEETKKDRIFSYKALGFNRDGLAYRALSTLFSKKEKNHLLIILSDASPSDIKPLISKGFALNKAYEAEVGLNDAKEELDKLRMKHLSIAGLIHKDNPKNASYLFYQDFALVKDMENLSSVCARLIKKELIKMRK